jgi:FAD/FMN-containing dehydrogenase
MWQGKRSIYRREDAPPREQDSMQPRFKASDIDALRQRLLGKAVLAGDDDYHLARQGFVVNYQAFPEIIVYCEIDADVAAALEFARRWKLTPICRSGGHNTAGYCNNNDLVIDLSRMNEVVVDVERKRATVGAGAQCGKLNAVLDGYRLHVPSGGCSDVAIGGYVQGGGYGFTAQIYGLNCDNAVEAHVMLADGTRVRASEHEHSDLFWALRGGTGNNFGVLLQIVYKLHDTGPLWGFGFRWPLGTAEERARAAAALETLQNGFTGEAAASGVGHQAGFNFVGDQPTLFLRGLFRGTPEEGRRAIAPLFDCGGVLDIDQVDRYAALSDRLESTPSLQIATHTRTVADSRITERALSAAEWETLIDLFVASPNSGNFIHMESYGGAIRAIAPTATAFWHRRARYNVFVWAFWQHEAEQTASLKWLDDFRRVMAPLSNGGACQNYPNRDSSDYRRMYWGDNFDRLLAVKQRYDPERLFDFGQAVKPAPAP